MFNWLRCYDWTWLRLLLLLPLQAINIANDVEWSHLRGQKCASERARGRGIGRWSASMVSAWVHEPWQPNPRGEQSSIFFLIICSSVCMPLFVEKPEIIEFIKFQTFYSHHPVLSLYSLARSLAGNACSMCHFAGINITGITSHY